MSLKPIKVGIITSIIAPYRKGFYDRILQKKEFDITIYCQKKIPGSNLKSIHTNYPDNVKLIKYLSAKNERVAWQFLPLKSLLKNDVIFFSGNPRVLSDVFLATFLRYFTKKKIVIWTMGHSFAANRITESIRLFWTKLFKIIFVYTDAEAEILKQKGFKKQYILGMNNGLDQNYIDSVIQKWDETKIHSWKSRQGYLDRPIILSCARLVEKNSFDLVIKALPIIKNTFPNILWCVIGDGEEKNTLQRLVSEYNLEGNVVFNGEIYDEESLAPWFMSSSLLVHPAAIGLSLLHAFGYGLPVITHSLSQLHGPEYSAFQEYETGLNYDLGDYTSLAEKIVEMLSNIELQKKIADNVKTIAQQKYNVDVMVDRFSTITEYTYKS